MEDLTFPFPAPKTEPELKAAIDRGLKQLERLRVQMDSDQAEIDRLKAETRAIIAQLKAS